MKMATVTRTNIYKLYFIIRYYFKLFPGKGYWKVPLYFWGSADIAWKERSVNRSGRKWLNQQLPILG